LGAGTGKLTRLLVLAFARVVAVEPADALRRLLVKSSPAAGVVAGAGRRSRSPNGTIDAVFAAEAVEQLLKKRIPQGNRGYDPLDLAGAHYTEDDWRHMFGAPFEPVRKARLRNLQIIDRNGLVAFFASMGWLADLPDAERSLLTADEYRRPWENARLLDAARFEAGIAAFSGTRA
jgi:methyltransferase family protein